MADWSDYTAAGSGTEGDIASAEANLASAEISSDWADWHSATGDEYVQWAAENAEWGSRCLEEGYTEAGMNALENAGDELGVAAAEYESASWYEADATGYTDWAAADISAASSDVATADYSADYSSDYSSDY